METNVRHLEFRVIDRGTLIEAPSVNIVLFQVPLFGSVIRNVLIKIATLDVHVEFYAWT